MADEDKKERVDRELQELLEELRVAIPGVEVLFAFLLGVAFTERFNEITQLQQNVYFATLLASAAATALLIAPTAYHRINFRAGAAQKERMLFSATRMALTSLVLMMASIAGVVFLVGDIVYDTQIGGIVGAAMAAWFLWFWFALPLLRRRDREETSSRVTTARTEPQPGT